MKNIVLYAPPAAGKGTECELLLKDYGYNVISIGQVLRDSRDDSTEIGRTIIECQDSGNLVPDEIVSEALKINFEKMKDKPLIIEGYPRNIKQAHLLDTILNDYIVINLDIEKEVAMKRTLGRLSCSHCSKIYNVYFEAMRPKVTNICDVCNTPLEARSDDNEETFIKRFEIYEDNCKEILDFYKEKGLLYVVDSSISKEYTHDCIKKILDGNK